MTAENAAEILPANSVLTFKWIKAACPPLTLVLVLQGAYGVAIARHLAGLSVLTAALTIAFFVPDGIARRLINDCQDYARDIDKASAPRPGSALELGLDMRTVWRVAIASATLALVIAVWVGATTVPWLLPILPVFVIVYFCYAGGPAPLGHRALGELLDFVVTGTATTLLVVVANARSLDWPSLIACAGTGCLFAALMLHNNARDVVPDRLSGKRTLPQFIGTTGTRCLYAGLLASYYVSVAAYALSKHLGWQFLPFLTFPWAVGLVIWFWRSELGHDLVWWPWLCRLMMVNLSLFVIGAFI
jgi:1,4-dihydroxy-2-naphthoate octaprenyltransferase